MFRKPKCYVLKSNQHDRYCNESSDELDLKYKKLHYLIRREKSIGANSEILPLAKLQLYVQLTSHLKCLFLSFSLANNLGESET